MKYKILERNGKFFVGKMQKKRKWLFGKCYEKFNCIWERPYTPACFKTLKEAKEFAKLITKPDIHHPV